MQITIGHYLRVSFLRFIQFPIPKLVIATPMSMPVAPVLGTIIPPRGINRILY